MIRARTALAEPSGASFDAVIFDCDGVLVDSEVIANRVWVEMAAELGYELDADEALRAFKGRRLTWCIDWLEARMGRPVQPDFTADFRARSALRFECELKAITGIRSVLAELGLPYCVASNGPLEKMEVSLRVTGLMEFFTERIFSAYELQVWKPDPGLFIKAAEAIGAAPARCAVVEDSLPGIVAGIAAGMTVFAYSQPHEVDVHRAQGAVVFEDMIELPALLGR